MLRCTHGNAVPVGAERTREYYQGGTVHALVAQGSLRRGWPVDFGCEPPPEPLVLLAGARKHQI